MSKRSQPHKTPKPEFQSPTLEPRKRIQSYDQVPVPAQSMNAYPAASGPSYGGPVIQGHNYPTQNVLPGSSRQTQVKSTEGLGIRLPETIGLTQDPRRSSAAPTSMIPSQSSLQEPPAVPYSNTQEELREADFLRRWAPVSDEVSMLYGMWYGESSVKPEEDKSPDDEAKLGDPVERRGWYLTTKPMPATICDNCYDRGLYCTPGGDLSVRYTQCYQANIECSYVILKRRDPSVGLDPPMSTFPSFIGRSCDECSRRGRKGCSSYRPPCKFCVSDKVPCFDIRPKVTHSQETPRGQQGKSKPQPTVEK